MEDAIQFFKIFYKMPELPFFDKDNTYQIFARQMRAYFIKEEGVFEKLAKEYHELDIGSDGGNQSRKQSAESAGTPTSFGSGRGRGNYHLKSGKSFGNSSDDSGTGEYSGRGRGKYHSDKGQGRGSNQSRNGSDKVLPTS